MGTLDHQIKLTTAQVIFYSLLQVANFTFSNMKFLLFVVAMVAAASAAKQDLDAIAAADAKLGLIEGKLSAFAGETATLKAAVDAYEAVVNTEGYGPTVQLFTPNV